MLAHEALAFNAHRAAHYQVHRQALQKKQEVALETETVVVTDVVYVTVYDDEVEPTPVAFYKGAAPSVVTTTSSSSSSSSVSSSTFSTSTTSPAEVPVPPPASPAPVPTPPPVAAPPPEVKPPVESPAPAPAPAPQEKPPQAAEAPPPTKQEPAPVVDLTPVTNAVTGGGKRGLAFNNGALLNAFVGTKAASWCYSWGQTRDGKVPAGMPFTPMMWCPRPDHEPTWAKNAEKAIAEGAKEFLSFNEPDIASQCNMDPATTAGHHKRLMNPYQGRVRISSPSVSNSNLAGQGLSWLKSFMSACNGQCAIDFCAIHWYSPPNPQRFLDDMDAAHAACNGKPIWITEFAVVEASDDQAEDFIRKVTHEMDTNPKYGYIERYSYFMAAVGSGPHSLMSSDTSLNRFGKAYASA